MDTVFKAQLAIGIMSKCTLSVLLAYPFKNLNDQPIGQPIINLLTYYYHLGQQI